MKAELDKPLEAKDQALGLYEKIEMKQAKFAVKERDCEDRLKKMGNELNAELTSELQFLDDNVALKAWRKKANQKAEAEKKKA